MNTITVCNIKRVVKQITIKIFNRTLTKIYAILKGLKAYLTSKFCY